jgi:outer membrane cobalamin receptor
MRIRSLFPFIPFLLAFLVGRPAYAGPVTGRVVDPDGRPVPNARVWIAGAGAPVQTTTDAQGLFTLAAPDGCRCEVRVSADGFRAEPVALDAASGTSDVGAISLSVSAISESLVVSATQVEIPLSQASSSITVITGDELRTRQVTTVGDALRTVPGLTVMRAGSSGALTSVFPRGGESDYTLVYLDGIQVNAFGGGMDFAHLSTANVDRIEIVRGPQSALYGSNAIGSVVRIVTRSGGPARGDAAFEAGSFGTQHFSAASSGTTGRWSWGGSADRLESNGFNDQLSATGATITNDDYRRTEIGGSGAWRDGRGALVRAQVMFGRDERGFPGPFGSNPIGVFSGIDTISRGSNDRWSASIGVTAPPGRRVRTHGQVTWNAIDSDFVSQFGESQSGSRRFSARGQADIAAAPGMDFSAGAEFQRERGTSSYITDNSGEIPIERYVAGTFVESRFNAADRFFATAGVRIENIHRDAIGALNDPYSPRPAMGADTVVSVNPKIAAAFQPRRTRGSETKLRASFGTGIRPPDAFELAFTDNPALAPERSRSVEVGIEQAFATGRGAVDATWFHNSFDDLIVAVGRFVESSRYRTDNISNARARGLELGATARHRAATLDVLARVSYTFLDSEILAVDRGAAAPAPFAIGQALLNRPRHQWALEGSLTHGRAAAWIRGGGRGRVLAVEPSYGTFGGLFDAGGYNVWNAGASWRLARQLEIFGRIDNLFDRRYEEVFGFPALGRGAFAGLRVAAGR